MLDLFVKKYFDRDYEPARKGFYLGAFASVLMMSLLCFIAGVMRYGFLCVFLFLLAIIIDVVAIYFAQATGRYGLCAAAILTVTNVVVLPLVHILRGSAVGATAVFFIPAVILCVTMLEEPFMHIAAVISVIIFISVQMYVFRNNELSFYGAPSSAAVLAELCYCVVSAGIISGLCLKTRIWFYSVEKYKAEQARSEALELDETKNVFLSNMSHEMRTPMNAILGTSQMLMESGIDEDSKSEIANVISACQALLFTVEDLLDFSYQADGLPSIHEGKYDIYKLVDDVVNMISISIMDKELELLVNFDPRVPRYLYGDGKRLRQVIIYMVANSIKYTAQGTIALIIGCSDDPDGENVKLEINITDSGRGMNPEEVARMFDTEYAVKNRDNSEEVRTILGLAFCKDVLENMNGRLVYEGGVSDGTMFTIHLPQKIVNEDDEKNDMTGCSALIFEKNKRCSEMLMVALKQCNAQAEYASSAGDFRERFLSKSYTHLFLGNTNYEGLDEFLKEHVTSERVIVLSAFTNAPISGVPGMVMIRPVYYINVKAVLTGKQHPSLRRMSVGSSFTCPGVRVMAVDDNLTNLKVVSALLGKYEMEVFTASGGQECLNRLENQEVDIIFLDYMMPEMDGIDTLKNIRAMGKPWTGRVPVIALTANAIEGVREMLLAEGFDDYLTKPVEIRKLEKCLYGHLPVESISISSSKAS